jgi:predicted transcriptional regulator
LLTKLFSSTRAELLSLFFNNPDSKFYLREIARHIGKDAAGIKRELDTLVKIGILGREAFKSFITPIKALPYSRS